MTREEAKRRLLNIERSIPNTFRTKEDVRNFEALEMAIKALQEPRKITYEDVKGYCKPRCLTIIDNELLYELTHPKIKAQQEPSGDLISRQAVDEIKELMTDINGDTVYAVRMSYIRRLSSVNPQSKTGHWIADVFVDVCSVCGEQTLFFEDQQKNYCPNCGAKMESVE